MPYPISHLLSGHPSLVTAQYDEPIQAALTRMLEYDYSQLPVLDIDGGLMGMITSDSILRALTNFDVTPAQLRVFDALVTEPHQYRADNELFNLLDDILDNGVVLITDDVGQLTGIVTTYDTTEYFRRRAEDIMFLQDIEAFLKEFISVSFTSRDAQIDREALDQAIDTITPSNKHLKRPFQDAVAKYVQLCSEDHSALDTDRLNQAFAEHMRQKPKPFEELTLDSYIELFLHESRWELYSGILSIDPKALRHLLQSVRDTRNDLAHFRIDEASAQQHEEIRFCREWLTRHQQAILKAFAAEESESIEQPDTPGDHTGEPTVEIEAISQDEPISPDEILPPDDSRYAALASFLLVQPSTREKISLSFAEIESLIGGGLPAFARKHRSWWANDTSSHVQSRQWLDAGWRVTIVDLTEETVTFSRIMEHEAEYRSFFLALADELQSAGWFPVRPMMQRPQYWSYTRDFLSQFPRSSILSFSFNRSNEFRMFLALKAEDDQQHLQLREALARRRAELSYVLGANVLLERRVSGNRLYLIASRQGQITDTPEDLKHLIEWASMAVYQLLKMLGDIIGDLFQPKLDREQVLYPNGKQPHTENE